MIGRTRGARLAAFVLALAPAFAFAQAYPTKPITMIVPFSAGGSTDTVARIMSEKLTTRLGQPVLVENKVGAGGSVGSTIAAKSPADGYTLLVGTSSTLAILPALYNKPPYDANKDFAPAILLGTADIMVVVNAEKVKARNVRDLLAYAKANPGKLNFASGGQGSISHLLGEYFNSMAQVNIVHVPYKGDAQMVTDLIGGQVDMAFGTAVAFLPHVKSGKVVALAVTNPKRSTTMGDLPTISEAGVPGYEAVQWFGIVVPTGTPPEVVNRLNAEMRSILTLPDVRARFAELGFDVVGGSPEDFAAFLKSENAKWKKIADIAKTKLDEVRVAVIGAGVVGLATASQLQLRGHQVTIIDPRAPGEYCSFGNAGCLSRASCVPLGLPGSWAKVPGWLLDPAGPLSIPPGYAHRIAPWLWRFHRSTSMRRVNEISDALHALLTTTIDKWRPLAARAGVPELIRQDGYAFAYESEAAFKGDALGRQIRENHGVKLEVLVGGAVREFDPALSPLVTHLVVLPEQGHVPNPGRLSKALAERLRGEGAVFVAERAVGFDFADAKVKRVRTSEGAVLADAVVIAAGAHSKELASQLGSSVPLETERGYHLMLESPNLVPRIPVMSGEGKYFATPMEGGLRIAGTVELGGLGAPPNMKRAMSMLPGAKRLMHGLKYTKLTTWMGHRPSMPDSLPVIGASPRHANAFYAFGHGHVGLTAAAPTGEIIADLVDGRAPSIDLKPYSAQRF